MSESIGFATDPLENLCVCANRLMQTNTALGLAESLAEYAEAWQKERDAMKARVAELEAEVERLRVIELPEITWKIWDELYHSELIDEDDNENVIWAQEAVDFVALLNEGRSK